MSEGYVQVSGYTSVAEIKKLRAIVEWAFDVRQRVQGGHPRVLEIGCGVGNIAVALAHEGFDVLGVDVDPASIDRARARNQFAHARFEAVDVLGASDSDFAQFGPFDLVVCSEVLQYVPDAVAALRRMRLLAPHPGQLVLTTTNRLGPYELSESARPAVKRVLHVTGLWPRLASLRGRREAPEADPTTATLNPNTAKPRVFTARSLERALRAAGFQVREWRRSDFLALGPLRWVDAFARFDTALADRLPREIVSGWYVRCD